MQLLVMGIGLFKSLPVVVQNTRHTLYSYIHLEDIPSGTGAPAILSLVVYYGIPVSFRSSETPEFSAKRKPTKLTIHRVARVPGASGVGNEVPNNLLRQNKKACRNRSSFGSFMANLPPL